ncbi:MAG TPA: molybdopterin-dependent oxidoreductase [Candidatus Eremiobacteraceae bacterium]|jgi:DMSO/TMAO reductase YedYZ molybdopterin-dependent catalytic subunit|nr:molybdopterin-dependent oxidoreductase [Candidatus Eremiobacteraceae bacterium]
MPYLPGMRRREFLIGGTALGSAMLAGAPALAQTVTLPFANGTRPVAAYPQKRPLIVMTTRPVQLETPMSIFNEGAFTPNDAFFVRWHLAGVPTDIDVNAFRISVHGLVSTPLQLSVADLKSSYDAVEVAAVCECSGNSRGFFNPRVPGGQWGNGAMGNALWKGVRLRDILTKAGIGAGAVQVRFNGADQPVLPATPDFMKSLDMDLAMSDNVILAYSMNGADLPVLNGYPVRLIVPGYFATYWVKMLNDIEVLSEPDQNFWMKTAYRIPADPCGCQQPGTTVKTIPINRLTVRSFITSVTDGARVRAGALTVSGIAFDSGYGIQSVLFSSDGGAHWTPATLGKDYGKYAFRPWQARFTSQAGKQYTLASLAMNTIGEAQRLDNPVWNPGGYLRNTVETVRVSAS